MPFTIDGERPALRRPPPAPDEHGREVLAELDYGEQEIGALFGAGPSPE
jgi:crotonobetainyl-CoA:carnitine CoA-transferase CaiB-like acyl-CoA transferase